MKNIFREGRLAVSLFSLAYILACAIGFRWGGNHEFVIYTVVMLGSLFLVLYAIRDIEVPSGYLWALSLMGVMHMAGAGIHIAGERLYSTMIWPIYSSVDGSGLAFIRYDQLVHFLGYAALAAMLFYIVRSAMPNINAYGRALLILAVAAGIGSFNEIAEFSAVLALPKTGVGDYANTMLDLIANTLGAASAVILSELYVRLKKGPR